MADQDRYDIVISGGGLVGLTLALALAQKGLRLAVVDALAPAAATAAGFDGRVSAIAFSSWRMLKTLGLWPRLESGAAPINDILVTDGSVRRGASPAFLHFDHREIGEAPLAYIVENRHLRLALLEATRQLASFSLIAPMSAVRLAADDAGASITLADGRILKAALCIAAEGRGSALRAAMGIKLVQWQYGQSGIVTTVAHERDHDGLAQEYFLPGGPFAILPMTGRRSSLVWTERSEAAKDLIALEDRPFTDELRRRFGTYLGAVSPVGPRWSYPLGLQIARSYIGPRFALIGDAAHAIHPIAGQGLNLGLRDVAALSEVLIDARALGLDLGAPFVTEKYQRWRRADNLALIAATDMLNRLFSNDIAPLRAARDLGLSLVNRIDPARRLFMRHAGGTLAIGERGLPKLLRGQAL